MEVIEEAYRIYNDYPNLTMEQAYYLAVCILGGYDDWRQNSMAWCNIWRNIKL